MKKLLNYSLLFCLLLAVSATKSVPVEGSAAPEIELIDPSGKTIKLSELKGKIVLIDFWASWCGPCRRENPNVVEAYRKYHKAKFKGAKGFEIFSVSLDRTEAPWKEAIEKDKLTWKYHGWDKDKTASKAYQVSSIPSGFLLNGEGVIVARGNQIRGMGLHVEIEKLLRKPIKP